MSTTLASFLTLALSTSAVAAAGPPITLESLLTEMTDRDAIARFPDPAYTCRQFSSYDRASKTADDPKTWFANGDANQYLRVEEVAGADGKARKEWVMADMDGPGAVVRVWSANPKGTMRVYLDGGTAAVIEAPMADALGGKWKVGPPLSQEVSRGWNLYLPIPYAKHCKITSDQDGFYYQVNYRTYPAGTEVVSLKPSLDRPGEAIAEAQKRLVESPSARIAADRLAYAALAPGHTMTLIDEADGPGTISGLTLAVRSANRDAALRATVITAEFDGEQAVWTPVSDFFSSGVGVNAFTDRFARVNDDGVMQSFWWMPFQKKARLGLTNLASEPVEVGAVVTKRKTEGSWTSRSMHFHASWHFEYPIHAYGGRGTKDWNYLEATGKGVYVGDSLAVMNPVGDWWGEGDEKIYVDSETFPSHFGTGTEDYYGYAWSSNVPFQHPFHAQPRCDGLAHRNTWGNTTVTRVRCLDAIPFTRSLKFDMEIWHWKECEEAYAATTYCYALPGATSNRQPQPEDAARPIPQPPPLPPPPPPFKIEGAIECEGLTVTAQTPGITVGPQDMSEFDGRAWSGDSHLWVQARKPGDFVELSVPTGAGPEGKTPVKVTLYATKSWDYGIVKFSVNGKEAGKPIDLFSGERGKCLPSGPIELGVFTPVGGKLTLRAEVAGGNERALGTRSFVGLDCVVLTPVK